MSNRVRSAFLKLTVVSMLFVTVGAAVCSGGGSGTGVFVPTGNMTVARYRQTATLLPTGKVLIAGGCDGTNVLASAELYDPVAGTFTLTGSMVAARWTHTATLLPNGTVLIAGGDDSIDGTNVLASAELYDPVAGTFTPTGTLAVARYFHTAVLLDNGDVLITGGYDGIENWFASAELYNLVAGKFTLTGTMTTPRGRHTATSLPSGKVLIAGGGNSTVLADGTASAELYDLDAGTFASTGTMTVARWDHTATSLSNGKVLIAGGEGGANASTSAELYDPSVGTFAVTGTMTASRGDHSATLLPSGKVLIAGGVVLMGVSGYDVDTAELYDPVAGTFTATGNMTVVGAADNATLLPNGKVLIAGGEDVNASDSGALGAGLASAELYEE
jgi:hypothetical protein